MKLATIAWIFSPSKHFPLGRRVFAFKQVSLFCFLFEAAGIESGGGIRGWGLGEKKKENNCSLYFVAPPSLSSLSRWFLLFFFKGIFFRFSSSSCKAWFITFSFMCTKKEGSLFTGPPPPPPKTLLFCLRELYIAILCTKRLRTTTRKKANAAWGLWRIREGYVRLILFKTWICTLTSWLRFRDRIRGEGEKVRSGSHYDEWQLSTQYSLFPLLTPGGNERETKLGDWAKLGDNLMVGRLL